MGDDRSTERAVTVSGRGTRARPFRLGRAAWAALGEPTHVVLLWDGERRRIGFRAAPADDPNAYPVGTVNRGRQRTVYGAAFLRHHGLLDLPTRRYPARMVGDVLVVELGGGA